MRKLLLLPLLLAAAACGGDGDGPTGSAELTAAEAAELNRAVFGMMAGLASDGISGMSLNVSPAAGENTFTIPIQETVPCTPSGTMGLQGTATMGMDEASGAMAIKTEISATPVACAHKMEKGGVITITGDPDIDVDMTMTGTLDGLTAMQMTEVGAFTWMRGGASGRCSVDITSTLDLPTQMVSVTGSFCGFPVSETFPIER
jgi:hypothetical protein